MPARPITVWFSRGLDTIVEVMGGIREIDPEGVRIIYSQTENDPYAQNVCDQFFLEPAGLEPHAYIKWVEEVLAGTSVQLIVPGHSAGVFAEARSRLESGGTRVLVPGSPATLKALNSKEDTYKALAGCGVPIPDYRVVRTLSEFNAAYDELVRAHPNLCFKPVVSVFGRGFHTINRPSLAQLYRRLASTDISLEDARACLGEALSFKPLMLMPVLPGPERSVDCLARDGELIRYIIRQKVHKADYQIVESNDRIGEFCAAVTRKAKLNGMFNVQFRDYRGEHYLLEINTRMAGGLYKASACGLSLPYWAVRLFTGTCQPEDIPYPRTDIRIVRDSHYVVEVL